MQTSRGRLVICYVALGLAAGASSVACVAPSGESGSRRGLFGLSDPAPAAGDDSGHGSGGARGHPTRTGGFAMGRDATSLRGSLAAAGRSGDRDLRTPPFGTSAASAGENFGSNGSGAAASPRSGELQKVEGNTWRTSVPATRLFSLLGRSLSHNYLLSRVDRRNLTVHTEWDKFFIDGRLFRNRLIVSVFPVSARQSEVVIRNNLEYFSGSPGKSEDMGESAWLPSPDITDEVTRLVDSVNQQILNAAASRRSIR